MQSGLITGDEFVKKEDFIEYHMPTGPHYDEAARRFASIQKDERYIKAISCAYCHNTADSFNRYVSTYCTLKHEHLAGFEDKLDMCMNCEEYRK